jgi:glutamyl-tRNA synthetase
MEEMILKHALVNAAEHEGRAEVQAVVGKIIAEQPELREQIKEIIGDVGKTVKEVNSWPVKKQESQLKKLGVRVEKEKPGEKAGLPELPDAKIGKVVMRLAPFPSGPLHIGNARMVLLNDEYVKKYEGKLLLVIDDTIGSEEKFIVPEAYDLILDGLKWLGVKWHQLIYKSDRLKFFYSTAEELIKKNFAYVCECDSETLRKNRFEGTACAHRGQTVEENLVMWKGMLAGKYKEGEATVRLKTDMKHPNPAFRDRVLLRIVEREHPRVGKKYRVWPLLEFSWAVDDQLLGVTHILRGKDLVMEDMMEEFIWDRLGWRKPGFFHYGLLNIQEAKLSKTEARKAITAKEYGGWDDPRVWSLQSLRKRGIQPEALRKFVIGMGLSLADVAVPAEILYAENRKIIDRNANRYFAVLNPTEISVKNAPRTRDVKANLHPDFPKRGSRKIPVNAKKIFVEKSDFEKFRNKEVGLINLFSVKLKKEAEFKSEKIKMEIPKIQWVSENSVKIKIVMPDGSVKEAVAEPDVKNLKENDLIQLVRVGFCRVDKAGNDMVLYFAHK